MASIPHTLNRNLSRVLGNKRKTRWQNQWFKVAKNLRTPPHIKVGNFCFIKGYGVFINGWLLDEDVQVEGIDLLVNQDLVTDLWKHLTRVERASILSKYGLPPGSCKPGFTASVELPELEIKPSDKVSLQIRVEGGKTKRVKLRVNHSASDPLTAIKRILSAVPSASPDKRSLFDLSYGPAISSIWAQRTSDPVGVEKRVYNPELAPSAPDVSLVIPIYGRYDFIEYQLSQFVNDPDMFNHEIIYVIDDPRIRNEVSTVCDAYEKLYQISFKVLYLDRNKGFAGANNVGVEHASAPVLLLVNSDVMPSESGWLKRLVASSGQSIHSSMIGARLLYEDDSIQHDGMSFYSSPFVNELWTNIHPHKGLPDSLVGKKSGLVDVEAITGACMLLKKSIFENIGGFDENFILGDYEDSDLCMRAREMGISIKMNSDISLYHLERQSQSLVSADNWKNELTYYNCWYHTRKWDDAIRLMKRSVANAN